MVAPISGICVIPDSQRKGIGSKLVKKTTDWGRKQDAVLLETDDEIIENSITISFLRNQVSRYSMRASVCQTTLCLLASLAFRNVRLDSLELRIWIGFYELEKKPSRNSDLGILSQMGMLSKEIWKTESEDTISRSL